MKGFHVSASGAIQDHHGSLVHVYTLTSTNINQSTPNLVKMYVTIRSQMSSIMDIIGPEHSELSALELEKLLCLTVFPLASANINSLPDNKF